MADWERGDGTGWLRPDGDALATGTPTAVADALVEAVRTSGCTGLNLRLDTYTHDPSQVSHQVEVLGAEVLPRVREALGWTRALSLHPAYYEPSEVNQDERLGKGDGMDPLQLLLDEREIRLVLYRRARATDSRDLEGALAVLPRGLDRGPRGLRRPDPRVPRHGLPRVRRRLPVEVNFHLIGNTDITSRRHRHLRVVLRLRADGP